MEFLDLLLRFLQTKTAIITLAESCIKVCRVDESKEIVVEYLIVGVIKALG